MTWTTTRVLPTFVLDQPVKDLLAAIKDAGHADDFRFVGGCVRNLIMNTPQSDIDLATKLLPEQVRDLFQAAGFNVHDTGIEHGTVTVTVRGNPYEITTLRRDVETDGRRAVVAFTEDWAEDAQRRDFRCNAIYMDGEGNLFDPVGGGVRDAMDRRLVFVGDAETRIREDALRILRFFRFQATLNAAGDQEGENACRDMRASISTLSGERIHTEMLKLLKAADPVPAIESMIGSGVLREVIGDVSPDVRLLRRVVEASTDPEVRLASLFWGDPVAATDTLDRWKVSRALHDRVMNAVSDGLICMGREDLKIELYRIGAERVSDRMVLTWAEECDPDMTAEQLHEVISAVISDIPTFPLKGADVVALGVKPGPEIGKTLKALEAWWITNGYPAFEECQEQLKKVVAA